MLLIAEKRMSRVSRAAAVVVLAVAAGALSGRVLAAEKVRGQKVRFSDSKESPAMPDGAKKDRSSSFGGLLDRNSSLGGVEAVPFSSVYTPSSKPADKGLTSRERDLLDQRNNWMQLNPDDFGLTEKSASKAFGVREYSLEDFQNQRQQRKGDLQRYVDKLDEKSRKEQDKAEAVSSEKSSSYLSGGDLAKPDKGESTRERTEFGQGREATGLGLTEFGILTRLDDKWFGRNRDTSPDSLVKSGMLNLFRDGFRAPGLNRFQPDRADGMLKRPTGELDANSISKPLLGALDPVNFQPDLTRQQLNPIIGQTINQASQAATVNLSDSLRPLGPAALFTRPGVVDGLNLGVATPPITATPGLPLQPQKDRFSPAMFEIPKRPF
jgi:hypothetical protein